MGNTDLLLDSIVSEIKSTNDALSELKQILIENARNARRGSGSGGAGGNRGNGSGGNGGGSGGSGNGFTNLFNTLQGEMGSLTRFSLGNNVNVENSVRALGTSLGTVSKSLAGLGGPIGMVSAGFVKIAEAGLMVYEYLNAQLKMYNDINSSGVTLVNGMNSLKAGANTAFMSVDEFSSVVKNNTQAMIVLEDQYGNGVEKFGSLVNSVQMAQKELGLYGLSQSQIADITAKNIKIQKMYAGNAQIRDLQEAASTTKFITDLTYLSRSMGTSIDELLKKTASTLEGANFANISSALTSLQGIPEELANEMTKTMGATFAGLGKGGDALAKTYSEFANLGYMVPEGLESAANVLGDFNQSLMEMNKRGVLDAEEYTKFVNDFFKDSMKMSELKKARDDAIKMGNNEAAQRIQDILNTSALITANAAKPVAAWEELTNRFNTWMGDSIMKPFNNFVNKTTESFGIYLLNLIDTSDGFWSGTWQFVKDTGQFIMNGVWDGMKQTADFLVGGIFKLVDFLFSTNTFELAEEYFGKALDWVTGSLGSMVDWAGDLFFGIDNASDKAYDWITGKLDGVYDLLGSTLDDVKGYWGKFKSWLGFGSDDEVKASNDIKKVEEVQQRVNPANQRQSKITSGEQNKTTTQVEATAKPEYKPPVRIESPETPKMTDPGISVAEQMREQNQKESLSTLKKILNKYDEQAVTSTAILGYLREISENTVPETNR